MWLSVNLYVLIDYIFDYLIIKIQFKPHSHVSYFLWLGNHNFIKHSKGMDFILVEYNYSVLIDLAYQCLMMIFVKYVNSYFFDSHYFMPNCS